MADRAPLRRAREGATVLWTFDRPEAKNAIDAPTMDALESAIADVEADPSVRAVVLCGAGDSFVSGGDVKTVTTLAEVSRMGPILDRLQALPVPVVAAVGGAAMGGGCEILVACDLRVVEEHATIAWRQIAMAVTPGWGGTARLVRLVGRGRAARMLLTGESVTARQALEMGLCDDVVPPGEALRAAKGLARRVERWSPFAVRQLKRSLAGEEREAFAAAWVSEDHAEAVRAFQERREPVWKGK